MRCRGFLPEHDALHKKYNSVIINLLPVFTFLFCIVLFSLGFVNVPYLCIYVYSLFNEWY